LFDRRNIGAVTVVGNQKLKKPPFDQSENPMSRDFNSTIGDEISPRETKSKSKESVGNSGNNNLIFNLKEANVSN
jgi:hypothetical protein